MFTQQYGLRVYSCEQLKNHSCPRWHNPSSAVRSSSRKVRPGKHRCLRHRLRRRRRQVIVEAEFARSDKQTGLLTKKNWFSGPWLTMFSDVFQGSTGKRPKTRKQNIRVNHLNGRVSCGGRPGRTDRSVGSRKSSVVCVREDIVEVAGRAHHYIRVEGSEVRNMNVGKLILVWCESQHILTLY